MSEDDLRKAIAKWQEFADNAECENHYCRFVSFEVGLVQIDGYGLANFFRCPHCFDFVVAPMGRCPN